MYSLPSFTFTNGAFSREITAGTYRHHWSTSSSTWNYFDPFNCECRAYGRLKEANREDLAVKAHGYLVLTPQQEDEVARRVTGCTPPPRASETSNLNSGSNFWARDEQHRRLPVRAIVKALAGPTPPDPAQSRDMWTDLQALHSLGIFVQDTHGGNSLEGGSST